jgi:Nucleotide-diphospho-sugar transferase
MTIRLRRSVFDFTHRITASSDDSFSYIIINNLLSTCRRTRWAILLVVPIVVVVVWNIVVSRNLTMWQYNPNHFPTDAVIFGSSTVQLSNDDRVSITSTTTTTTAHSHNLTTMNTTILQTPLKSTNSSEGSTTTTSSSSFLKNIIATNSTMNRNQSNTLIIGFSDDGYKEIAWRWYQELSKLGYTEHMVVAQDISSVTYFQQRGMRHDYIHVVDLQKESLPITNVTNFRKERCVDYDRKFGTAARQHQIYKRSLFGSRWTYVLRTLQAGTNVLLTDVDNVFVRYKDLSDLEQDHVDSIHAYAGFIDAFPRNIFHRTGFTICGGMSWLRASAAGVVELVQTLVERCGCQSTLSCSCKCDDQVTLNSLMLTDDTYKIEWDENNVTVPLSEDDVRWEEMIGTCTKTGHRVKIWNRNIAFRRNINKALDRPLICPDPTLSWIAMPSGIDRFKVYDEWRTYCPSL